PAGRNRDVKICLLDHVKKYLPYNVKICLPGYVKNSLPYDVKNILPNNVKKCLTFAVMETEYHGQLPCIPSRVLIAVLNGCAGHLTHSHNLRVRAECHVMEFFQIFMDVRAVRIILPPVPG